MNIVLLTDDEKSWFIPFGNALTDLIKSEFGYNVSYIHSKKNIPDNNDILFLLSCVKLVEKEYLEKSRNNIVVHASDLPKGKGFSPLKHQILEGKNCIPLTLFEAVPAVDAGPYYLKDQICFNGYELLDELQEVMAKKIIDMILLFLKNKSSLPMIDQVGEESFYERFSGKDDEIDPSKSIISQFDKFRIADNTNYPKYFFLNGRKYIVRISHD